MGEFALAVFAAAVVGLPAALVLLTQEKKKRGCGRGCASCGTRYLCHPGQYSEKKQSAADKKLDP